ncbi:antirepressor [Priestia filamentosa]|uniref:Antirepressor n=1 Tax=Priestia filamentosa TaxID=1402861 RepID=A0A0H4KK68_9BACI|nr:phage antirepressor [Priestia filamentosa]AKO92674.1 antirepressor [Priestia filamentosa]
MDKLTKLFQYQNHQIRTVVKNDEPWFVAKDVCEVLEISKYRDAISRLDFDERESVVVDTLGGQQEMTAINESGLYCLILTSRKQQAKQFKRWVTQEVIPSIRKHGAYMTPKTIERALLNPDTIINLATQLKDEQQKRMEAERLIDEQKPKVVYAEAVTVSEDTVLVKDLAITLKQQGLDIGANRLFSWLRVNGYLCKQKGDMWNMPTQKSLDLGVIVIKHGVRTGSNGEMKKTRTPRVTGKGQIYFINKLIKLFSQSA